MRYQCPHCRSINVLDAESGGTAIGCGRCQEQITVPESQTAPGTVFGDFVIKEVLVSRSHETDFVAEQISLGRDVVLKVLNKDLCANQTFTNSFITAARKASSIHHPFLGPVHAIGKEDDLFYLARETGDMTLKRRLVERGALHWEQAARVVCDVAEGLDHAWFEGQLLHLNLKPDYIVMTNSGRAQVDDVGLAGLDPDPDSEKIVGTPQYISPERIVGLEGDNRSDLYSLGISFYFMITGEFPFSAGSTSEIITKHLQELPKPANKIVAEIPPQICSIINMLLEKNPNLRYQSGKMLVEDLQAVLRGETPKHVVKSGNLTPTTPSTSTSLPIVNPDQQTPQMKILPESPSAHKPGTLKVRLEGSDEAKIIQLSGPKQAQQPPKPVAAPKPEPTQNGTTTFEDETPTVEAIPEDEAPTVEVTPGPAPGNEASSAAKPAEAPLAERDEMDILFDELEDEIGDVEISDEPIDFDLDAVLEEPLDIEKTPVEPAPAPAPAAPSIPDEPAAEAIVLEDEEPIIAVVDDDDDVYGEVVMDEEDDIYAEPEPEEETPRRTNRSAQVRRAITDAAPVSPEAPSPAPPPDATGPAKKSSKGRITTVGVRKKKKLKTRAGMSTKVNLRRKS